MGVIKEKKETMKKIGIAIFSVLAISVLAFAGTVTAPNYDMEHYLYQGEIEPTVDGTYSPNGEWDASGTQAFGTDGIFRDYWVMDPNLLCLLIETGDTTNDAGDYWVICWDSTYDGGGTEPDGGAAPQTNDNKLVVTGHGGSATVQWYQGTGTAWATHAGPAAGVLEQAQTFSVTPKIGTAHAVLEMYMYKMDLLGDVPLMGYTWGTYIGYYDATTETLQAWPPTPATADVPDSWGFIPYESAPNPVPDIPEGITVGVMLLISTIAVIVGMRFYRKQPKYENW